MRYGPDFASAEQPSLHRPAVYQRPARKAYIFIRYPSQSKNKAATEQKRKWPGEHQKKKKHRRRTHQTSAREAEEHDVGKEGTKDTHDIWD